MYFNAGAFGESWYEHHSYPTAAIVGVGQLTVSSCQYFPQWKLKQAQRKICCGNTRFDEPEAKKPCAVKEENASTSFHQ